MSVQLIACDVSVTLGKRKVLNAVSFEASKGEFLGLIGPNGAGKSTLLKTLAGLLCPDSGAIRFSRHNITDMSPQERARKIAYLPQARSVYWSVTARDIVALGRFAYGAPLTENPHDTAAIERGLKDAGADHLAKRPAAELSGGELARVHLARALAGETPLLLADEPIAALDPAHQMAVMTLLKTKSSEGGLVIAALHDLSLAARYCSRLIVLKEGSIASDGAPGDVLRPSLLKSAFSVDGTIVERAGHIDLTLQPIDHSV
ncbi:ABC transporter ATP-binding protein [Hyphococcus flavus]|uniref:ABC transporter ATP-binding protein n=1 Tax=Hyphococcus flavus TaxID=1866326 RepID=A0AAF0CGP3_9PROT|nr:ABC transporter ATP-binding protein [Hyphococcus flavus]WDI32428.1 ABC transporter ATP-binding protein [Hyphococcus flavus]